MTKKVDHLVSYEPKCEFCQWKKEHPDLAQTIEYRVLSGRSSVANMVRVIAQDYGKKFTDDQLSRHIKRHLPSQALIVKRAMESGLDGLDNVTDMVKQNLLILQTMKELGIQNLASGKIEVDRTTLIAAIAQQHKMIEGDKVTINYGGNQPPLFDREQFAELIEMFYDFVPITRRMEFRNLVDVKFKGVMMAKAKERKMLALEEARAQRVQEQEEVIEVAEFTEE